MSRILLAAVALATVLASACSTNLKGHVVQADGRAIEIVEAGSGAATVVFESGLGDDWTPWDDVASAVSVRAQVFAYSRPGYGASAATASPRDAFHIVEELRTLLTSRGHPPPYILVGHSIGGTYMELFAKLHPAEVSAVVLVDPRHRDFLTTCDQAKLDLCGIPAEVVSSLPQLEGAEYNAFAMASGEIRAAGSFGPAPVRVLTATDHGGSSAREALWESMLKALAAEAPDGNQIVFPGAGPYIQSDRSTAVAKIIVDLSASTAR